MYELIAAFPQNLTDALAIAKNQCIKNQPAKISNVVILGMGGSGIGGKIVSQWVSEDCGVPVQTINDYSIPAYINSSSVVIASSYSGNTEETLLALYDAHKAGAHIIGICSGGILEQFCRENNFDCVVVPGGNPPRTALAYSMVVLTSVFVQLHLTDEKRLAEITAGEQLIRDELNEIQSEAKAVAQFLHGSIPVVYAGVNYEGVAIRAKQQFNENSKELCWQHVIPEMNHNELVGWGGGDDRFAALFLHTNDLSERNQRRFEISVELVQAKTRQVKVVEAKGNSQVERSIYLIHLVDWASLFLSDLKSGDPMEIRVIDYLKDELSKI